MMEQNIIKQDDTTLLAFEFVAPVSELIHLLDREPQMKEYVDNMVNKHIDRFIDICCN